MAKSPLFKVGLVFGVLAVVAVLALILSVMASYRELCEVCITFGGRSECREAYGKSQQEAIRTATDNACAVLGAGGMTDSISCSNTTPDRATCRP